MKRIRKAIYLVNQFGDVFSMIEGKRKILKKSTTKNGKSVVRLRSHINGEYATKSVSIIIAERFLYWDKDLHTLPSYRDGNKQNNNVENIWFKDKITREEIDWKVINEILTKCN